VEQKRLPLVIKGSDPHWPRLREWVTIPLAPKSESEERVIDDAEMPLIAIRNDEIEITLTGATRHGATANVLDCRIR
jgi:hypothetical protein